MGLTICTQQALKLMKESGVDDGHIIHINSVVGHSIPNIGTPVFNIYPASKHAVTALTETLRQELVFLKSKVKITVSFSFSVFLSIIIKGGCTRLFFSVEY